MSDARKQIGKLVADDLYIHRDSVGLLDTSIQSRIVHALDMAPARAREQANVFKINDRASRISLLTYASFFEDPFPCLTESWTLSGDNEVTVAYRSYTESLNPPILHRKELLLESGHPLRTDFEEITRNAEVLGLFEDTSTIGFKENWLRHIANKGYQLVGTQFVPIGNDISDITKQVERSAAPISRHLTALTRSVLSAPVQLLARHTLLSTEWSIFDYGCGKGNDIAALSRLGYAATGWDPFYAPSNAIGLADVVNLGFVLNVIEDPAERLQALRHAFSLAKKVLSVAVMLRTANQPGTPYGDGVLTSRNTFQKYFYQEELRHYVEEALREEVFLIAPGVAFVFPDKDVEQRFTANRFRRQALAHRILRLPRPAKPARNDARDQRAAPTIGEDSRRMLAQMWEVALDLGRVPEQDEIEFAPAITEQFGTIRKATRLMQRCFDRMQLQSAARVRADDVRVFFSMQHFAKRAPYKSLELRLQRDVKSFFGDYRTAQQAGLQLLLSAAQPEAVASACKVAAECGMGWLDREGALHVHLSIVERLPPVLRAYIGCGLLVYGNAGDAQLAKVHALSGKLTLTEYEEFEESPLPRLVRRVKINIRKQDYEVFEYGGNYEKPLLYFKSRYLNEEYPGYPQQEAFDSALERLALFDPYGYGVSSAELAKLLEIHRWSIDGFKLVRSRTIPPLDQPCGQNYRYRDLIECGETQKLLRIPNLPTRAETYNALFDLAIKILDPIIEYFGCIRLTYCFSSQTLSRQIKRRIAPRLDQHAAFELGARGGLICDRGGAACDFLVQDEDMKEVAQWIMTTLPFDRLYFYAKDRPLHVSYRDQPQGIAFEMRQSDMGHLVPRKLSR